MDELDDLDREILYMLQRDARHTTATEISEQVGVTANTVRNRIRRLESRGIIKGYTPRIDYEAAAFQLEVDIICTAPITDRTTLAEEAMNIDGVVQVRERMTGRGNVIATAVTAENDDLTAIASRLDDVGFTIESEELVKNDYRTPFDGFSVKSSE